MVYMCTFGIECLCSTTLFAAYSTGEIHSTKQICCLEQNCTNENHYALKIASEFSHIIADATAAPPLTSSNIYQLQNLTPKCKHLNF